MISDDFGIGIKKVAEIRRDIALKEMMEHGPEAFGPPHLWAEWRAMRRRLFNAACREFLEANDVYNENRS